MGASEDHAIVDSIVYKLGNGELIDFWHDKWLGAKLLCNLFSPIFQVVFPEWSRIAHNGFWNDEL